MKNKKPPDFEEAISRINEEGVDDPLVRTLRFERFVLELLSLHIESQSKTLHKHVSISAKDTHDFVRADAFAPDGFDDFVGPTVVDIKPTHVSLPKATILKTVEDISRLNSKKDFKNLIIIFNQHISLGLRKQIDDYVKEAYPGLAVSVWDPAKLREIADKHPNYAQSLLGALPSVDTAKAVRKAAQGKDDDWQERGRELLADLRNAWKNNDLVAFLGAGVSIDAGVPSWNGLLNQLLVAMVEKMGDDGNFSFEVDGEKRRAIAQRLQRLQESSPLLAARYIRSGLGDRFEAALRRALYSSVSTKNSPQLEALARLCVPRKRGSGVHAIVTYNFDDLLEQQLTERGIEHQSIYLRGTRASPDCLAIHHVHGLLPQRQREGESSERSLVVFSEEGYHGLYNDPYSWSNIVQLNLLSEHTCVFIGLSMNDPSLRRLLEISARNEERPRHVALLRRITVEKLMEKVAGDKELSGPPQLDTHLANVVLAAHHQLIEKSFEELGVKVAWYRTFEDVAGMIDSIRHSS